MNNDDDAVLLLSAEEARRDLIAHYREELKDTDVDEVLSHLRSASNCDLKAIAAVFMGSDQPDAATCPKIKRYMEILAELHEQVRRHDMKIAEQKRHKAVMALAVANDELKEAKKRSTKLAEDLESTTEKHTVEVADKDSEIQQLKADNATKDTNIQQLQGEVDTSTTTVQQLQQQNTTKDQTIAQLRKELAAVKEEEQKALQSFMDSRR